MGQTRSSFSKKFKMDWVRRVLLDASALVYTEIIKGYLGDNVRSILSEPSFSHHWQYFLRPQRQTFPGQIRMNSPA